MEYYFYIKLLDYNDKDEVYPKSVGNMEDKIGLTIRNKKFKTSDNCKNLEWLHIDLINPSMKPLYPWVNGYDIDNMIWYNISEYKSICDQIKHELRDLDTMKHRGDSSYIFNDILYVDNVLRAAKYVLSIITGSKSTVNDYATFTTVLTKKLQVLVGNDFNLADVVSTITKGCEDIIKCHKRPYNIYTINQYIEWHNKSHKNKIKIF